MALPMPPAPPSTIATRVPVSPAMVSPPRARCRILRARLADSLPAERYAQEQPEIIAAVGYDGYGRVRARAQDAEHQAGEEDGDEAIRAVLEAVHRREAERREAQPVARLDDAAPDQLLAEAGREGRRERAQHSEVAPEQPIDPGARRRRQPERLHQP